MIRNLVPLLIPYNATDIAIENPFVALFVSKLALAASRVVALVASDELIGVNEPDMSVPICAELLTTPVGKASFTSDGLNEPDTPPVASLKSTPLLPLTVRLPVINGLCILIRILFLYKYYFL